MPVWEESTQYNAKEVQYTVKGAGVLLCSVTMELDNKKITYFRKNMAVWDLLAFIGGFSVALMYAA